MEHDRILCMGVRGVRGDFLAMSLKGKKGVSWKCEGSRCMLLVLLHASFKHLDRSSPLLFTTVAYN